MPFLASWSRAAMVFISRYLHSYQVNCRDNGKSSGENLHKLEDPKQTAAAGFQWLYWVQNAPSCTSHNAPWKCLKSKMKVWIMCPLHSFSTPPINVGGSISLSQSMFILSNYIYFFSWWTWYQLKSIKVFAPPGIWHLSNSNRCCV